MRPPTAALLLFVTLTLAACGAPPAASPAASSDPPGQTAVALGPSSTAAPFTPAHTAAATRTVRPPTATARPTDEPAASPSATAEPTLAVPTAAVPTADPTALAGADGPLAPTPAPTAAGAEAAGDEPARIVVDTIGMDRPLIAVGLDERRVPVVPNHDVGWYLYSASPGQGENVVLWGHVLRFRRTPNIPAPFARLKELAIGAPITIYSADGAAHRYVVTEKVLATPDQVEYILPQGRELLTLVSCIGDKVIVENQVEMTHRLITIAEPAP